MRVLVTGGAGFIGSAVIRELLSSAYASDVEQVINCDKLTYAGNLESLASVSEDPRYVFEKVDVCDAPEVKRLFEQYRPSGVLHLAAESHVDRSIDGPGAFIQTNIVGTFTLLNAARNWWSTLSGDEQSRFRFLQVSTDEVYGSLGAEGLFSEASPYDPHSPYAASKASADHLARAWHDTFGLPVLVTNCSNNYGPCQFPEKLIPLTIHNALAGKSLPVYGKGENVRDWLHVEDHARALITVLQQGKVGETYNIGGSSERRNIDVVRAICKLLDEMLPESLFRPHERLITFVTDRPGHDQRYAIDAGKIQRELSWSPRETFDSGLRKTVLWYLANRGWCDRAMAGRYAGERLGTGPAAAAR